MPSRRNRIQNMPAIQLARGYEVERSDKEAYPTRHQDRVGQQVIQCRNSRNQRGEHTVEQRDGQRLVKLDQRRS